LAVKAETVEFEMELIVTPKKWRLGRCGAGRVT
jgi:hypothetical protein